MPNGTAFAGVAARRGCALQGGIYLAAGFLGVGKQLQLNPVAWKTDRPAGRLRACWSNPTADWEAAICRLATTSLSHFAYVVASSLRRKLKLRENVKINGEVD